MSDEFFTAVIIRMQSMPNISCYILVFTLVFMRYFSSVIWHHIAIVLIGYIAIAVIGFISEGNRGDELFKFGRQNNICFTIIGTIMATSIEAVMNNINENFAILFLLSVVFTGGIISVIAIKRRWINF